MKNSKNWKLYCQVAFNALNSNIDHWGDPDFSDQLRALSMSKFSALDIITPS